MLVLALVLCGALSSELSSNMFLCFLLLVRVVSSSSSLSTSLYRAVEVRSDSLTFLPVRDQLDRRDVMECGLSCSSSSQDCPGFSYNNKQCTRLAVSCSHCTSLYFIVFCITFQAECIPTDLLSDGGTGAVILLYIKPPFSQPCIGKKAELLPALQCSDGLILYQVP